VCVCERAWRERREADVPRLYITIFSTLDASYTLVYIFHSSMNHIGDTIVFEVKVRLKSNSSSTSYLFVDTSKLSSSCAAECCYYNNVKNYTLHTHTKGACVSTYLLLIDLLVLTYLLLLTYFLLLRTRTLLTYLLT